MEKIPTLFKRDLEKRNLVTDEVTPGCEWVINGEGVATRKFDGTCCLVRDGRLYKRYELRRGKTPPPDFEPVTDVDPETGKQQGWVPVKDGPDDKYHREAWEFLRDTEFPELLDGTYELCGPKVQGNPEGFEHHTLVLHGGFKLMLGFFDPIPTDWKGLSDYLSDGLFEGIVWHHEDGRMCKIKAKDFGIERRGA